MVTEVTHGVKVTVRAEYKSEYSRPMQHHHVFTYHVTIENNSEYTVQLMRRHWEIYEGNGTVMQVDGEGVIGEQPILAPGEVHEYASGCHLKTGIGKMSGYYTMERLMDGKEFLVTIPEFTLIASYLCN
ncbi:MAG: Co2+/Mg2+ efflux protein ApaG [Cytophagales bacterium]|nr:Co2+/Mg2+ efflux protein ApaG [Bernardetiaceae bacterium]MDW8205353.1 Co2+/Mg2+ efflux protein ApaG [Cytophagales bacterium]